jgi:ketosteroid isomerase-like protein
VNDPLSTVQAIYGCFGRGDIPALLELLTEDVDWRFIGDSRAGYSGRFIGRGQVAEWFGRVAAADDIQASRHALHRFTWRRGSSPARRTFPSPCLRRTPC